jgi:hypothetical protein
MLKEQPFDLGPDFSVGDRVWSDEQFDIVLGRVLRAGVILSAAIVAVGGAMFLLHHDFERPIYDVFKGEPRPFRSVEGVVGMARDLTAAGWCDWDCCS